MTKKIIISLTLLIFSYGVYAMGIKQCLFSEMTGVVSFEGKPAAGVKLVRVVNYDKDIFDETMTDELGNFQFPAIYRSSILSKILPMEFVVYQNITAHFQGNEIEMWSATKRSPEENAESKGRPLIVECNLNQPEVSFISVDGNLVHSRCNWDVEADPDQASFLFGE
jgi:hypothetical protein